MELEKRIKKGEKNILKVTKLSLSERSRQLWKENLL